MKSNQPSYSGQRLWDKALDVIPGGNMLLSKNKNLFSPGSWPCYYSKAKGARVWDLDGRDYLDFTTNGVGSCSLGHSYQPVDDAVCNAIRLGVMSSLNAPIEVELAEILLSLNPWADMTRFARTGGEANAIAIRIARAYTNKDKVAICGYHGWHDWYLAANLTSHQNLNSHLIDGLNPAGVPSGLADTILPMSFNSFDDLERIERLDDVAAIKMEVARSKMSSLEYLKAVREVCNRKGIVLIFDECTSGFRESYGGVFNVLGVYPDMAMFGKAMGNGYAITAVTGKREIMLSAVKSFISSTFWTEAIGPTAACKTLYEMKRLQSWEILPKIGSSVKSIWSDSSTKFGIPINIQGLNSLPTFTFACSDSLAYKTLFTEKMLELGFLASTSFYPTIAHTQDLINLYREACTSVFEFLGEIYQSSKSPLSFLSGSICSPTFKRLT